MFSNAEHDSKIVVIQLWVSSPPPPLSLLELEHIHWWWSRELAVLDELRCCFCLPCRFIAVVLVYRFVSIGFARRYNASIATIRAETSTTSSTIRGDDWWTLPAKVPTSLYCCDGRLTNWTSRIGNDIYSAIDLLVSTITVSDHEIFYPPTRIEPSPSTLEYYSSLITTTWDNLYPLPPWPFFNPTNPSSSSYLREMKKQII